MGRRMGKSSRAPPYDPLGPQGPRPHELAHRTPDRTQPGQLKEFNPMDFVHGRENGKEEVGRRPTTRWGLGPQTP